MSIDNLVLGSDHRGIEIRRELYRQFNAIETLNCVDVGPYTDASVDYPVYAQRTVAVMTALGGDPNFDFDVPSLSFGVLICGSGIGVCMAANRYYGIRAATCRTVNDAHMTRRHNDANILCIGADHTDIEQAVDMLTTFINTTFDGERHERRVSLIDDMSDRT